MRPLMVCSVAAGMAAALVFAAPAAASMEVEHRLEIELVPARRLLMGRDELTVRPDGRERLVFFLSARAVDLKVEVRGRPRDFSFRASFLEVPLEAEERGGPVALRIAWTARFDDPVPLAPVNTDNPGFGVSASITEAGAFLLPGSGWYPDLIEARDRFPRIRVQAPWGMLAVTLGRSLGHWEEGGFSISSWSAGPAQRGLALAAGRWLVREKPVGETVAAVYFTADHLDLAPTYLEAVAAYLKLYAELFGPYPFEKFAVVENFFPTGYGFPSFTLLGGSILRLPFVLERSLAHEIAHCWWGNGVLVDYEQGNWSEGLTTYVSDYLLQARRSEEAAREARLQSLRNYATLVPPEKDFPLARFTHRSDPVSRAVGYDKAMMVFHMLRRRLGEEAFWGALRDLYASRRFEITGWDHLRRAFEIRSGEDLSEFFDQWVHRRGAPEIELQGVSRTRTGEGGWEVTGRLVQGSPPFAAPFEIALETAQGTSLERLELRGREAAFAVRLAAEPLQVTVDPDAHTLRRLSPVEIPPTVNSLRSGDPAAVVFCGPAPFADLAATLAEALGLRNWRHAEACPGDPAAWPEQPVIFLGPPADPRWLARAPAAAGLAGRPAAAEPGGEIVFAVFAHPAADHRPVAVFSDPASPWARRAAVLVPHYGRYSRIVFRDGRVRERETWATDTSKVVYRWMSLASGRSDS